MCTYTYIEKKSCFKNRNCMNVCNVVTKKYHFEAPKRAAEYEICNRLTLWPYFECVFINVDEHKP